MTDESGTFLWKDSYGKSQEEVQAYWSQNVNSTQFWKGDQSEIGTDKFFETVGQFIRQNYAHRYQVIESEAARYPGGKVLEVGCGAGWEAVAWCQAGMDYYGVDLSPPALKLARKNLKYHALTGALIPADGESLPFADASFDIVTSLGVLHHSKSTKSAIAELARVLKPEGEAVVTLYHKYSWKILLSKIAKINFEFEHEDAPLTRLYTKAEMFDLFDGFGTIDVHLDYTKATPSPRDGKLANLFNRIFVPIYNAIPEFVRGRFGHAIRVVATKS